MRTAFKQLSLALLLTTGSSITMAEEGQWAFSTGIDYSSGDYGGDPVDTDITFVPFTTSYKTGQWKFKATVPWVRIIGPGTVVGAGDGGVVIGNSSSQVTRSNESGLGDIWLSASYETQFIPPDLFYLDLTGKIKLPTADEDKGLGTGETDYTLQADLFKPLGQFTPFATFAYKIKGDPSGVNLDNVFYLSGGSDFRISDSSNIGTSLDYQEASTSSSDDSLDLFAYLNQKINGNWSYTLYGYKGLKDGSPDYGLGLQTTYKP